MPLRSPASWTAFVASFLLVIVHVIVPVLVATPAQAVAVGAAVSSGATPLLDRGWAWPSEVHRVIRPFQAPAHAYGAGHRGVDLEAGPGAAVRAPTAGTVAFSGAVAGRGVLTIDHGDGLVTTLEPVVPGVPAGASVARGEPVARVDSGGHAEAGSIHLGVRLDGEYVNPLLLLEPVPRAVLLPCC